VPRMLITGASRGLGLEFVRQYAESGWEVIATCRRPEDATALKALADRHAEVALRALDVTDAVGMAEFGRTLPDGPLDLLVQNAGVYGRRTSGLADAASVPDLVFTETMTTNVLGPLRLAAQLRDALAIAGGNGAGKIAFVSSRMGSIGAMSTTSGIVYRASKAALNAVVKAAAIDFAPLGIAVVALHPGWVRTDMGGAGAEIDATTSVSGMRAVIDRLRVAETGRFVDFTGTPIPW